MENGQLLHGTCYVSTKTLVLAKNMLDSLQFSARFHHMLQLQQLHKDFFTITSSTRVCLQVSQLYKSVA